MGAEQSTTNDKMASSDNRTILHRLFDPANVMGSVEAMPVEHIDYVSSAQSPSQSQQLPMTTTDIPSPTANIASSSNASPIHTSYHQRTVSTMSSHISLSLDEFPQLTDVPLQKEDEEDFEIEPQYPEEPQQPRVKHGRVNSNVDEDVVDEALARIAPPAMLQFLKSESKDNHHVDMQRKHHQLPQRSMV